jgi:chemotaxis protein histidine kinase CheA
VPEDHDVAGPSATTSCRQMALSDELVASLREAFCEEVVDRMPRLLAVRKAVPGRDVLNQARRDAHSLAGSAAVVGEAEAARCARAVELQVEAVLEHVPASLPAALLTCLDLLESLLTSWLVPFDSDSTLLPAPAVGS